MNKCKFCKHYHKIDMQGFYGEQCFAPANIIRWRSKEETSKIVKQFSCGWWPPKLPEWKFSPLNPDCKEKFKNCNFKLKGVGRVLLERIDSQKSYYKFYEERSVSWIEEKH